jgi:hypothetical protein
MWRELVMSRMVCCCALVAMSAVTLFSRAGFAQDPAPPPGGAVTLAKLEARIESALGETTSLQFLEQPLGDVVAFLEERHKIEIQLDNAGLDTAGVNTDTPVTIDVEGISLRSALNLMLKSIELTYAIQDGVLLVTTTEETENKLVTKVYDVRRFLFVTDKHGERKRHAEPLFDLVTGHVEPTSWEDVGGTGSIQLLDQSAVVSQSWGIQQEVGQFFTALELALDQFQQGTFNAPIDVGVPTSGLTQVIREALSEPTSLQFLEQPIGDVAAYLENRHKIAIQLDATALDTAGMGIDSPVTIDVEGIPLGSALNLMLGQIDLTYSIRDEVLLFTTEEEVEGMLATRIYPVADLIAAETKAAAIDARAPRTAPARHGHMNVATPDAPAEKASADQGSPAPADVTEVVRDQAAAGGGGGFFPDTRYLSATPEDRLLDTVTYSIDATSWTDVGGTGVINFVPQFEGLVVSQTQANHAKIEALLTELRRVNAADAADIAADDGSGKITLRAYRLTLANAKVLELEKLVGLIQRKVEPELWRNSPDEHFAEIIDQAVMIQTTNANHRRIGDLISRLGYRDLSTPAGGGGAFGGANHAN